ncbi:hypothetical protein ABVT39_022585 [Epinephelus coioides]
MTATASERDSQREMEAELAQIPTWLRAVGTPPVSVPPWLPSLLPAVPPRLHAPFPLTLGTQPEKHQKETRGGPVTNQVVTGSNKGEEGHLMLQACVRRQYPYSCNK